MKKRKILAILITILFLILIFYKIDLKEIVDTFKNFDYKPMLLIIPLYLFTLYIRGIRWKSLLLNRPKYNAIHLSKIFTVGSMLNIFLPARGGDIYRAYYLGKNQEEKKMKIFGSIILERTLDGICVFLILLAAVLLYFKQPWILHLCYGIGGLFIGSLIIFYIVFKFNKIDYVCNKLSKIFKSCPPIINFIDKINTHTNSFIEGFEALDKPKCTIEAFFMSATIWIIECYVAYLIINSFHLGLGFGTSLFAISLTSFSTMLPSTSVLLGPYQYAYILALGIYGINKSTALAIATVHQVVLIAILSIVGLYYLTKFNLSVKEIQQETLTKEKEKENVKI